MANYKSLLLLPSEKAEKGVIERLERVLLAPGSEVAFEAHLVPETQSSFSGFVGAVLVYYVPRYSTGCQSVQGN